MNINQQMSEFQLAQAQKEIVEDVLGVKHVVNTSRNAINNFNKKLGKELHVKTTDNPTLTNLIKDTAKMKKANVHYEPNTSLWYKIDGDTLYIRGHEAEGYSERVLYTDDTLSNNGWVGCTCTKAIIQEQIVPISCASMFRTCKQLTTIQGLQNIVMNCCTSCYKMFFGCYALQSIDCSNWDMSNVKSISYMFAFCYKIQSIDCSNWDTCNVEDMYRMFYCCYELKDIIGLNDLDVHNVKNMACMFCGLEQFTDLDISKWNAPKCEDAQYMFSSYMNPGNEHYNGFVRINAPNLFRSGCVKNLRAAFQVNPELKYVNISNWNVSNVENLRYIFFDCPNIETLDLRKWNACKCTDASFAFSFNTERYGKNKLKYLRVDNLFKNGIISNVNGMFQNLDKLKTIGDISNWDVQNVTLSNHMFYNCVNLKHIGDLSNWNMPKCTNAKLMFGCNYTLDGKVMQFEQLKLNNLFKDGIVSNVSGMFQGCDDLEYLNISNWNVSNLENASYMINPMDFSKLKYIGDLSNWDLSSLKSCRQMFMFSPNLTSIGSTKNWNISNVTDMTRLFNCTPINGLDMKNWDTSKCTNMYEAFGNFNSFGEYGEGISYIKSLCPIHKGTNTAYAFWYNRNLTTIEDSGTISASVNFAYSPLTHDSALVLINALDAENPGTLTLSTTTYETLTDEDKAIAISKGWTIAA